MGGENRSVPIQKCDPDREPARRGERSVCSRRLPTAAGPTLNTTSELQPRARTGPVRRAALWRDRHPALCSLAALALALAAWLTEAPPASAGWLAAAGSVGLAFFFGALEPALVVFTSAGVGLAWASGAQALTPTGRELRLDHRRVRARRRSGRPPRVGAPAGLSKRAGAAPGAVRVGRVGREPVAAGCPLRRHPLPHVRLVAPALALRGRPRADRHGHPPVPRERARHPAARAPAGRRVGPRTHARAAGRLAPGRPAARRAVHASRAAATGAAPARPHRRARNLPRPAVRAGGLRRRDGGDLRAPRHRRQQPPVLRRHSAGPGTPGRRAPHAQEARVGRPVLRLLRQAARSRARRARPPRGDPRALPARAGRGSLRPLLRRGHALGGRLPAAVPARRLRGRHGARLRRAPAPPVRHAHGRSTRRLLGRGPSHPSRRPSSGSRPRASTTGRARGR